MDDILFASFVFVLLGIGALCFATVYKVLTDR